MDWTSEDNMVDGLFFFATLTGRNGSHTPFVQAGGKRPTPVRRHLSRTHALLGRVIPGVCVVVSGMKMRSLVGLSAHSAFHWWSVHCAARMLLSEKLMSCGAAGTNGCLDLRCHAYGRVSAELSRCSGSMVWRPGNSVTPVQRSSVVGRLRGLEGCPLALGPRHPVTIRKASLMVWSMRRVWALRHQTGAQYSAVEWTRVRVAVRNVVAPAPQPEPASRLRSVMRDVSFLRCRQYVSDLSNVTPRYLGSEQKGRVSLLKLTFSSWLASLLLRWKTADTVFVVMSFSFQVWRSVMESRDLVSVSRPVIWSLGLEGFWS